MTLEEKMENLTQWQLHIITNECELKKSIKDLMARHAITLTHLEKHTDILNKMLDKVSLNYPQLFRIDSPSKSTPAKFDE